MIYYLEGPDGTGKTTLARNLVNKSINEKRTCFFFHCTNKSAKRTPDEDYSEFLQNLKNWKAADYDVVIDRAFISNIVYSSIYEPGKSHISESLAEELFKIIDLVVICLPKDKAEYLRSFEELAKTREEDYIENMDKVYDMFDEYANRFHRYDMFQHFTDYPDKLLFEAMIND